MPMVIDIPVVSNNINKGIVRDSFSFVTRVKLEPVVSRSEMDREKVLEV